MALMQNIKTIIKGHPIGLYFTELYKKHRYEAWLKRYSDRECIEKLYRKRNPARVLRIDDPQTFSDKMQWMKLYYRDDRMTRCSDKWELKSYLAEQDFGELAVPTLAVYEHADQIDETALPERFVLKAAHGSGWNVVCNGDKQRMAWGWLRKVMGVWLSQSLYIYGREWNYKDQTPRIVVEPLLCDEPPVDYKFMCFNGAVRAIQVNHRVDGKPYWDFYETDWTFLKGVSLGTLPCSDRPLPPPERLEEMKTIAGKLSEPFPFVRVDMYAIDGKLYVGEMTFFPAAGFFPFTPPEWDRKFGDWLTLPEKNTG